MRTLVRGTHPTLAQIDISMETLNKSVHLNLSKG